MLTPGCMKNGWKGVEELPARKMYFNLGTLLVQNCLVLKIFMVPSDRISQKKGTKKCKSNYLRKNMLLEWKQNSTTMLAISILSDDLCLHKKLRKHQWCSHFCDCEGWTLSLILSHFDRQHVPASDITKNRPTWTWISMN